MQKRDGRRSRGGGRLVLARSGWNESEQDRARLRMVAGSRSGGWRRGSSVGRRGVGGEGVVEVGQQEAELGEAVGTESLLPFGLDLFDDVAHRACCALAAFCECDALEALVARIVVSLQVAEALELAEQVVERLLAHAVARGQ